jgi:hypothetical protein
MRSKGIIDVNPFFIYIIGFAIAFIIYSFNWSFLYPTLSTGLIIFFTVSFIISFLIGVYFYKKGYYKYRHFKNTLNIPFWYTLIVIGFIAEFAYARAIPLVAIITGQEFDYTSFGIPTFHVILVTFTGFFTVQLFNCYMSEKKLKYLFYSLSLFIFPILIFSRGTFLVNLSSIFFVYLISTKRAKTKIYIVFTSIILIILLLFGISGNVRSGDKNSVDLNDLILTIGDAKPEFVNSPIPKEYFWAYLYISSPLANLQYNIDHNKTYNYSLPNIVNYANSQLNFDFISKRIESYFGLKHLDIMLIDEHLAVATIYSYSFSYLGWLGICITFIFIMTVTFFYSIILKPSNVYFATGIAILNTMILFSIFDNMFAFSGLSFQLIYPFLLSLKFKKRLLQNE